MRTKSWYEGKSGNHQGLIIEEESGKNIAVSYDKADAQLIASAPELLDLLKRINYVFYVEGTTKAMREIMSETKSAIAKAEGGN